PYQYYRDQHGGQGPRRVLVLGAGTGNDVHIALANGAEQVVAVEIDPEILRLGKDLNKARPYDDPRVRTVVTDARQFVGSTDETFDLIVIGTLDSQTLLSGQANLRLENYVYTVESFASMRSRLAKGGMVAAYYSVFKPWLFGRIYATVARAFDGQLRLLSSENAFLFNSLVLAAVDLPGFAPDPAQQREYAAAIPATDDWPFNYLQEPTIATIYQYLGAVLLLLVALSGLLVRKLFPGTGGHLDFLLLGLGFTLVESAAIVRMALLFGSTWVVHIVVFLTVLVMVFLANRMVIMGKAPSLRLAWPGVFVGIACNAIVPLESLLVLPSLLRALAAALLVGIPVYCASVCFSRLFAKSPDVGGAFGMNLVGLMAGGMCEYVSMVIGMRGVWWVAAAVYLAALLCSRRRGALAV
ncbi:MAG: methyltransferase domain-containing protein, partial [Planctomycetota bacterium]